DPSRHDGFRILPSWYDGIHRGVMGSGFLFRKHADLAVKFPPHRGTM
ncbi:hypothetical protein A2U01_0071461, partial [Trifolium medium]|nr:hypothetical protein [Trifolium medium]